jgi:hypothetical protein
MKRFLVVIGLLGCRTEFVGDPHISPPACQAKCAGLNMRMSGMVFMGEYSSACLCEIPLAPPPPGPGAPPPPPGAPGVGGAAAAAGAAAGVVMQMRREDDEANRNHRNRF